MSSRAAEETGGVLSFTFLDVLTCTMGTLVLLLVVVGERAKKAVVAEVKARHAAERADDQPPGDAGTSIEELAQLKARQAELDRIRAEAAAKLRDEQLRVSHLEDHHRRLEHELAQLHFTLERLQEAEGKQRVDQETASRELERLKQLIADTEAQIKSLRDGAPKKRSYAIVPYKGANGTSRRPIYIECTADAVTIQPEGIRLTVADFDGPIRSGNPLAAAVRAAREDLNARAAAAGVAEIDLPDPYPLLLVRPDGAAAYAAALSAIRAWDSEYGYEFVDADWKLEFPPPDPQLGQVMTHAVDQARQRQALLAKVAPRRYGSRLMHTGAGGEGDGDGFDELAYGGGAGNRIGQNGASGNMGIGGTGGGSGREVESSGNSLRTTDRYGELASTHRGGSGGSRSGSGNFSDEFTGDSGAGEYGGRPGAGAAEQSAGSKGGSGSAGANSAAGGPGQNPRNATSMANLGGGQTGTQSGTSYSGGAPPPPNVHAAATMAPTDAPTKSGSDLENAGASGTVQLNRDKRSMAETRGANWANAAATQRASAVTRPVKVIVRVEEMQFVPETGASTGEARISFQQPTDQVMDQLAANVQRQIDDWGLAGRNMYWRPNLVFQVQPGAERQAMRLVELLEDSGVDVKLPEVAARPRQEATYAR